MAEPTDPAKLTKVQAQDAYNAAAAAIDELLDDFPNPTWDPSRMNTWLIDAVSHWMICGDNWLLADIGYKDWYKLEYSLLVQVPDLPMDLVSFACTEFNDMLDYNLDVIPLPVRRAPARHSKAMTSQLFQDTAAPGSRMTTPAPLPASSKPTTPILLSTETRAIEPGMAKCTPSPLNGRNSVPRINLLATSPKAPAPSTSNSEASKKQVTQPPADKATGAQHQMTQRRVFLAATHSSVIPGPNPAIEDSVASLPGVHEALFLPGTDDELEHVQGDLVEDDCIKEEVDTSDEDTSPPPMKMAHRLHQEPRISFIFDDTTGDLVNPYPTIFLPRYSVIQEQNLHHSARPHSSPVNPSAAYLKAAQRSKADLKKKRKDTKGKDKATGPATSLKHTHDNDDSAQNIEKLVTKKLKSKDTTVADDKVIHATPVIRRCGPGPSKPLAVTLGVGGGGFGEKVPSTAKAIKSGLKSIGVLEVKEDFGTFVNTIPCLVTTANIWALSAASS
ncbi:hypothetical protein ARMGADRAFT_1084565 [Armillaria gallica]|uniref:Uncharacterized protein n=1 Tax=Armillaria gallica TaxID=47427 RepID=A0A2H3DHQ6_ARMGA|nr:hypothetical protein ARMGADRAFT_1084565 [Armillaria gallica]